LPEYFTEFYRMEFTAQQIAQLINGTVEGNPEATVSYVSKIEEGTPGTISFLANPKYTQYIFNTDQGGLHRLFQGQVPVD
jgi:UDP-3-O-[3-hydroxymyristoyl] glucosamine N-acyltransferase